MEKKDAEPKTKLFRLKYVVEFEAPNIAEARRKARRRLYRDAEGQFPAAVERVVRAKYSSRADRLAEAQGMISDAKSIVESLKEEVDEWYNNLPENFQNGDKGSQLEECTQSLESVETALDDAESNCESVEFPGMFG